MTQHTNEQEFIESPIRGEYSLSVDQSGAYITASCAQASDIAYLLEEVRHTRSQASFERKGRELSAFGSVVLHTTAFAIVFFLGVVSPFAFYFHNQPTQTMENTK